MIQDENVDFANHIVSLDSSGFNSNIANKKYLKTFFTNIYQYRLLAVDNMLTLPVRTNIAALITSTDVLHS